MILMMVMTLKNHRLRSSLKLLFFGLEFSLLFLCFLFLISFLMFFRAVDSGVPPRSSTVPVSIQVQCKYGGVVWFVQEFGRFDQAFEELFKELSTSIGFPGSGRERQLAHICSNSTKRYSTRGCKGTFTHLQIFFVAKKVLLQIYLTILDH